MKLEAGYFQALSSKVHEGLKDIRKKRIDLMSLCREDSPESMDTIIIYASISGSLKYDSMNRKSKVKRKAGF